MTMMMALPGISLSAKLSVLYVIFLSFHIEIALCRDKFVLKKDMTGQTRMPIRYGKSLDTFFNDGRFYGWTSQHSENKGMVFLCTLPIRPELQEIVYICVYQKEFRILTFFHIMPRYH